MSRLIMSRLAQVMTTANWNNVMYDAGRANGVSGQLFIILIIAIGWLVIMNLFLSILLVRCWRARALLARRRVAWICKRGRASG